MTLAELAIAAARECIGTPFRHQGRRAGSGVDCAGVLVHVGRKLGLHYTDATGYGRTPAHGMLEQIIDSQPALVRVPTDDMQPGDVALMRFAGAPQHLAIITEHGIVHAYESAGRCCEHVMDDRWRARIVRVYRFMLTDHG